MVPIAAKPPGNGLAKGNSFSCHEHWAPNAEGSVHMPNSDQKPGRNITLGQRPTAARLACSQRASLA